MIEIEPARGSDPALRALLHDAGLPTDDLEEAGRTFFMASQDGSVCGSSGFEVAGHDVLLRSIAVIGGYRGHGVGREITLDILERAHRGGAVRAYLLTTSAASFFESLGFSRIERRNAPEAILQTRQATSICPASAVLMVKDLAS